HPLPRSWVEIRPTCVVGNLEPSPLISGDAVQEMLPMIRPDRQFPLLKSLISRRRAEEEHILFSRTNPVSNHLRKEFPQPWTAGEYILIRNQRRAIGQGRSEDHTSELQSRENLVCRL